MTEESGKRHHDQTKILHESDKRMGGLSTEVEDLVTEIKQLDIKLAEQEQDLRNKMRTVSENKNTTKQKVRNLFAELRHLLDVEETAAFEQLDGHFDTKRLSYLEINAEKARSDKSLVDSMLRNDAEEVHICRIEDVIKSLTELKKGVIKRDHILREDVQHNIAINNDITETFRQWKCIAEDDIQLQERTENACEDEGEGLVVEDAASSAFSIGNIRPSAPPLETPGSLKQEPEDPPTYWQAVGLSAPHEGLQPTVTSPNAAALKMGSYQDKQASYSDIKPPVVKNIQTYPCNSLENWHSFSSKGQTDPRSTLPIALSWGGGGKICLGDKSNKKVKFFNSYGVLMAETMIDGEIHDVSFLEIHDNEAWYIVSLPRACTFCILALKPDLTTKVIKNIVLKSSIQYNCVSRGPREQTLVGGSGMSTHEPPCVDLISFDGRVLKRFKTTPNCLSFAYPKSVAVYGDNIIVSDWKLNTVSVFSRDGSPVGQYTGTPTCPLMDPSDITVDHLGNVLILDGQLPNIHVIDLKCSPIEIIKIPSETSDKSSAKLLAFETTSKMLATIQKNGQVVIYSFRSGYDSSQQGEIEITEVKKKEPDVLPYIEGMLPSTIENIRGRPRSRTGHL